MQIATLKFLFGFIVCWLYGLEFNEHAINKLNAETGFICLPSSTSGKGEWRDGNLTLPERVICDTTTSTAVTFISGRKLV